MGAVNDFNRFSGVENLEQAWFVPLSLGTAFAVGVGDFCYDGGAISSAIIGVQGNAALPANVQADQGSLAANQALFVKGFAGVSQEQILLAETVTTKQYTLRADGICDVNCVSGTYAPGALMGLNSGTGGLGLDPQTLVQVNNLLLAVGVVIPSKYNNLANQTRVRIQFTTRRCFDALLSRRYSGGMQGGQNAKTLSDANYVASLADPYLLVMAPTTGRTITLPKESLSQDVSYEILNNSGGANSITMLGSLGSNVLGNPVIPQGKMGSVFCDGLNWYGGVSA